MAPWARVFRAEECPPGTGRFVRAGTLELAVFHVREPDAFIVIPNSCPHAGGNLSAGELNETVVRCPWHQWEFDLRTGACVHNEQVRVRRYTVRVEDGWLELDLTPSPAQPLT